MIGPGKYDDACTVARLSTHARGVVLIVVQGHAGNGFSVQAPIELQQSLPILLRAMADMIEDDNAATPKR